MILEIGYNHSFDIRTEKNFADVNDCFSILYLSDLHLNKYSQAIVEKIITTIVQLNPTIILLGGDYVDTKKGMVYFNYLLASISHRENIFAVAGNHDYGNKLNKIKKTINSNNANWVEKESIQFKIKNTNLIIDGNKINKKQNGNDFSILLLHKPIDIQHFKADYNLAFAGHLHGCQFVFWRRGNQLFPGKLLYKWNILQTKLDDCAYFISKGLGDTLPIRYNCRRDVLFIEVVPTNKTTVP